MNMHALGDLLKPAGWVVAVLLVLLGAFLHRLILEALSRVAWFTYNTLGSSFLLRGVALRRYRKVLRKKHQTVRVPFGHYHGIDIEQVYVPLGTGKGSVTARIGLGVPPSSHVVILGPPGSGKSVLLKHWLYRWAVTKLGSRPSVLLSILLDLNDLTDPGKSIDAYMVDQLRRDQYPVTERFLNHLLEHGQVSVLLDGLDEVRDRGRIAKAIKAFIDSHPLCPTFVTCREAVYHGDLDGYVEEPWRVLELDDRLVRRFLINWQGMSSEGAADELIASMKNTPRVMKLASNPLLLMIIAYLYTDVYAEAPGRLPHTRMQFFEKATETMLLQKWKNSPPMLYGEVEKMAVLKHLALAARERNLPSLSLKEVMSELENLPREYRLAVTDHSPILKEIVEQSGLLLKLEGGTRFEFAHQILQEFFAAEQIGDDASALLTRWNANREAWRETVELWCTKPGRDSTKLIEAVFAVDRLLALECIADAQVVDQSLAEDIVGSFEGELRSPDPSDVVSRAFGALASDAGSRGRSVFEFLRRSLITEVDASRRTAIANALAATGLARAAEELAADWESRPEAHQALVAMGDVAVPQLARLAVQGSAEALDGLASIGTIAAAEALTSMVWENREDAASSAAWRLAALLPRVDISETLDQISLNTEWRSAPSLAWIWSPFETPGQSGSSLSVIAGRIGYLLKNADPSSGPSEQLLIDQRLGIPLVAVGFDPKERHRIRLSGQLSQAMMETNTVRYTSPTALPVYRTTPEAGAIVTIERASTPNGVNFVATVRPSYQAMPNGDVTTIQIQLPFSTGIAAFDPTNANLESRNVVVGGWVSPSSCTDWLYDRSIEYHKTMAPVWSHGEHIPGFQIQLSGAIYAVEVPPPRVLPVDPAPNGELTAPITESPFPERKTRSDERQERPLVDQLGLDKRTARIFQSLPVGAQLDLGKRLLTAYQKVEERDWRTVLRAKAPSAADRRDSAVLLAFGCALGLLGLIELGNLFREFGTVTGVVASVSALSITLTCVVVFVRQDLIWSWWPKALDIVFSAVLKLISVMDAELPLSLITLALLVSYEPLVSLVLPSIVAYGLVTGILTCLLASNLLGWTTGLIVGVLITAVGAYVCRAIVAKALYFENPLSGLAL